MQFVSDLHLHSKYARAVSKDMVLPITARYAKQKGIDILTVSDWTHGLWFKEIRAQLEEAGEGFYKLKQDVIPHLMRDPETRFRVKPGMTNKKARMTEKEPLFLLSTEIASIYSQDGRVRRIHNLVFAPNFEIAEKINKELVRRGCNLLSDGRPIIGLSSKNLLELILSIDPRTMLIPCHAWTPHFGVYGSASGFETLEEAFGELSKYVYGIETGLSSDPEMNWQIKELSSRSILSFSDAHSPAKMAREATVFELEKPSYENIRKAIMRNSKENRVSYTIEFYPEEGKYHFSGHRNCKVVFGPEDIKEKGNICPVCKKRLTEGVLFRVQQLGNVLAKAGEKISPNGIKWYTDTTKTHPPYVKLVPLLEIVAEGLSSSVSSQKSKELFGNLCTEFGSEIEILLKTPIEALAKFAGPKIAEGVERVRLGTIVIDPGYDGEYGKVKIWEHEEKQKSESVTIQENNKAQAQLGLF